MDNYISSRTMEECAEKCAHIDKYDTWKSMYGTCCNFYHELKEDFEYSLCSLHIGTEVKFTGTSASVINIDHVVTALEEGTAQPISKLKLEPECEYTLME